MKFQHSDKTDQGNRSNSLLTSTYILIGFISFIIIGLIYRYDPGFDPFMLKKESVKADLEKNIAAKRLQEKKKLSEGNAAFDEMHEEIRARYLQACQDEKASLNHKDTSANSGHKKIEDYIDEIFNKVPAKFSSCDVPIVREALGQSEGKTK